MINGINLGGWLVTERWITPSLYGDVQDEHAMSSDSITNKKLIDHYSTFIQAKDFAWIAERGFEIVRLPVGYGLFGDSKPFNETVTYVDNAFKWAEKYNLKILLDLHTAPGSQNGNDHSGKRGEIGWHTNPAYIENTIHTISRIAERYKNHPQLWGIELLNEPDKSIPIQSLTNYYRRAYDVVREHCGSSVTVVISDAYRPMAEWQDLLNEPTITNMLLDVHLYQSFGDTDKKMSLQDHIEKTFSWQRKLEQFGPNKVIVGEWSVALHKTYDTLSQEAVIEARELYKQAQRFAFANTSAQFYWTYKTEHAGQWSYRSHSTVK